MFPRLILVIAGIAALCACAGAERRLPRACSGVPGDMSDPNPAMPAAGATHGPGTVGVQLRISRDRSRPLPPDVLDLVPMLYVFDDSGAYASRPSNHTAPLTDPLFDDIATSAFWGEMVDSSFYWVPTIGACEQTELLGADFSPRAPAGGLLFVQYTAPDCELCDNVTRAVASTLAAHPELPARWLQFDMQSVPRRWCRYPYAFIEHSVSGENPPKDLQCPKSH